MGWDWEYAWSTLPILRDGFIVTIQASLMASVLALAFGLILAIVRYMEIPILGRVATAMVHFLRGTPLIVQLYVLFFVLPTYGIRMSALVTGVLGLGFYASAFMAEVYRGTIEAVPAGQWEAARTLGMSKRHQWRRIILPQAALMAIPMLGNYLILMFKESALLSVITVEELLHEARALGLETFRSFEPLTIAGLLFLSVSYPAAKLLRVAETRLRLSRAA